MGRETRLEQLTRRTYRIRLERPVIRESGKGLPPEPRQRPASPQAIAWTRVAALRALSSRKDA